MLQSQGGDGAGGSRSGSATVAVVRRHSRHPDTSAVSKRSKKSIIVVDSDSDSYSAVANSKDVSTNASTAAAAAAMKPSSSKKRKQEAFTQPVPVGVLGAVEVAETARRKPQESSNASIGSSGSGSGSGGGSGSQSRDRVRGSRRAQTQIDPLLECDETFRAAWQHLKRQAQRGKVNLHNLDVTWLSLKQYDNNWRSVFGESQTENDIIWTRMPGLKVINQPYACQL